MLDESIQQRQRKQERKDVQSNVPVETTSRVEPNRDMSLERQVDGKQELPEAMTFAKKIEEPPDVSFCALQSLLS